MAWFDSAPEEKKRMRNQRKDASVLKQMEANSASVEPNEQVWDLDGELQRTRDVYATPSVTGSPVSLAREAQTVLFTDKLVSRSRSMVMLMSSGSESPEKRRTPLGAASLRLSRRPRRGRSAMDRLPKL
jgi:hypothetical protein